MTELEISVNYGNSMDPLCPWPTMQVLVLFLALFRFSRTKRFNQNCKRSNWSTSHWAGCFSETKSIKYLQIESCAFCEMYHLFSVAVTFFWYDIQDGDLWQISYLERYSCLSSRFLLQGGMRWPLDVWGPALNEGHFRLLCPYERHSRRQFIAFYQRKGTLDSS